MAHWFDELTQTLANEKMSRRHATRRISGIVTGVVLTSLWFPEDVLAESESTLTCKHAGTCSTLSITAGTIQIAIVSSDSLLAKGFAGAIRIVTMLFARGNPIARQVTCALRIQAVPVLQAIAPPSVLKPAPLLKIALAELLREYNSSSCATIRYGFTTD